MAPLQSKKRKSADSLAPNVAAAVDSDVSGAPTGSPVRKKMKITLSQKQALIDNLQLEITDRARRLRATYSHQALSLRSRIETRVNRIPRSLRKATMGELLVKYTETLQLEAKDAGAISAVDFITKAANRHPLPAIPHETSSKPPSAALSPAKTRGVKRTSDAVQTVEPASDKENAPNYSSQNQVSLSNPKKRSKINPPPAITADRPRSRAASRTTKAAPAVNKAFQPTASKILSPRSPNSRTLQCSPSRNSPTKSLIARPVSPLKPASPLKATTLMVGGAVAASLAGMVEHAKHAKEKARKISPRGLAEARKEKKAAAAAAAVVSTTTTRGTRKAAAGKVDELVQHDRIVSSSSNSSSGTVVTKGVAVAAARKPAAKKVMAEPKTTAKKSGASAAAKAAVTKKAAAAEMSATGRRVLRKRG